MHIEIEHRFSPDVTAFGQPLALRDPWDENGKPNKVYDHALTAKRWTFWGSTGHGHADLVLRLQSYRELGRPTPRHRFKVLKAWDKDDEHSYSRDIRREDVPVPLSVQHEAAEKVSVIFVPWDRMTAAEQGPLGGKLK